MSVCVKGNETDESVAFLLAFLLWVSFFFLRIFVRVCIIY